MTQNQELILPPYDPSLMDWNGQQPSPRRPERRLPPPADNPPSLSAEPPDWIRRVV